MSLQTIMLFMFTATGIAITPGPGMLYAFHNGVTYGMRVALCGIGGTSIGIGVQILVVAFILDQLLKVVPDFLVYIQWFGMGYLCFLAWQLWTSHQQSLEQQVRQLGDKMLGYSGRRAFRNGLLIAASNPKGYLFFSMFFPQFIDVTLSYSMQYTILALVYIPIDIACAGCYALGGTFAARFLNERGVVILNRICALIMVAIAVMMAFVRVGQVPS